MELEEVKFRRSVQAIIALTVRASEVGKFWWGKYLHDGYGYWWVTATGFSLFDEGGADTRNEALWSLALALLAIDFGVQWIFHTCGARTSKLVHVAVALLLGCLSIADLALTVGAGGARVSLPLVLFAITECGYVFRMVRPWLHYVVMSLALLISLLVLLSPCLRQLGKVAAIPWRMPWVFKLALAIYCGQSIWNCRRRSEGVGSDMLSQLGSDAFAMMMGKCFPAESREALSSHGTAKMDGASIFPPLLIFHWEAGADILLDSGPIANATPFLHHTLARPDVFAGSAIASVPVTLKTAWEVLCGVAASSTSDFREQGSSLRRECLPRALKRCCGYHSILVKTDKELPDIPRRVFGFEATMVAEDMDTLLPKLHAQLTAWDAYNGVPVLVYFYGGDAHPPYYAEKVDPSERGYVEPELLDIFLALNRRTDRAAEQLAEIWPPKREGKSWGKEHGLVFYLGDHGEQLTGRDPPPHGNLVSPDVTRTMMLVEARSFASDFESNGLVRMADVYASIADVVGLKLNGSLFVGQSLFEGRSLGSPNGSRAISIPSFSFYRPGDLSATHFFSGGHICSAEFLRGSAGWSLHQVEALQNPFGHGKGLAAAEEGIESCRIAAMQQLRDALRHRQQSNELLTDSNVHAAWLFATMRTFAWKAKAFAAWMAKVLLRPFLPAPAPFDAEPDHSSSLPTQHGTLRFEDLCIGNGTNHSAGVEALTLMN